MKKLETEQMEQVLGGLKDFYACAAAWMRWHTEPGSQDSANGMDAYFNMGCDSGWGLPY